MNYGYQLAASGIMTAMYRQDVAANNLANVETAGFKPDSSFTIPRQAARIEDRLSHLPSNTMLERLGAGVLLAPNSTSFTQGSLVRTGNDLDVAIRGEGFLTVSAGTGTGRGGAQQVRLTRDGRLTLNDRGELVTVTGGHNVLSDAGRPITLEAGEKVVIDGDGTIRQGGAEVARIRLANVPDKRQLRKVGHNLYAASNAALNSRFGLGTSGVGELVQGHIEGSAVDTIKAMMAVQSAASAVSSATRIMSVHDEITGRLISSLGRVSA